MILRNILILLLSFVLTGCGLLLPEFANNGSLSDEDLAGVLFINEISADNSLSTDWVELYNSHSQSIELSGFYLSDTALNLIKWEFPKNTFITGNGYLVVTFNGDNGLLNADFGLNAGNEGIYLSAPRDATIVDSIALIPPTGLGSSGRSSDGAADWIYFATPTKGAENL